ncbi:MAG TPA: tyrosine-protein phosphatase [Terriglobales bacterium]|nr:tyrosine-protein phosphatase [Terriglobales bacterium]
MTAVERRLSWDHLLNARDVGGLPTPDGWTHFRALVRSDDLRRLTPDGQAAMLAYGVTTIVDLRSPRERGVAPNPLRDHPGYRPLPYLGSESAGAPSRFETAAENYLAWLATRAAGVARIMHGIAEAPPGGVLVHCHAGKDRTGVVVALLLSTAGVEREAIAEDYALSVWWNEAVDDQEEIPGGLDAAERLRDRRIYYPRAENMLTMLAEMDRRHGGVDRYLDAIGVGPEVRQRLRERLA